MRLIKGGAFVEDPYTAVSDDSPLPETGLFVVTLARFKKDRDAILARNVPIGVRLTSADSPESLGEDLRRLSLVVLEFPYFKDGRAFSWARMLRTRLGFMGEIRGCGHFLYDQIAFMDRSGFDAYEVPESFTLEQFRRALGEISVAYQPSIDGRKTIRDLRANR
jgi:uncharacterized protein (DUF934 family)